MNPLPRKRVEEILAKAKGKKILVIGDAMLDRSIYTTTTRNSPELADVPVLDILETKQYLGGADNVACNVFDLGCQADILTVIPSDHVHPLVRDGIKRHEAKCKTCTYTVKERVLVDGVQKFRLDTGNMRDAKNQEGNLIDSIRILVPKVDAVIVSDYNKGVITQAVFDAIAEHRHLLWFSVNAKPENNVRIHDCSLLVLNRKEAAAYAPSKTNPVDYSPVLLREKMTKDNILYALVTLGADGMILYRHYEKPPIPVCAFGDCANDVCGAGDTVVSAATIGVLGDALDEEFPLFASMCAGIAVSKEGTATVTPEEVLEMSQETSGVEKKSLPWWHPDSNFPPTTTVLATGCYDLPHVGHIDLLNQARKLGDRLVVGINCDKRVRELKGDGKPILPQEDRAFALLNLKCVDEVVIFDEDTSADCIRRVKPDIYVKGADYRVDEIPLAERQACEELGIEIKFVNNVEKVGYKSSRVIDAVAAFLGVNPMIPSVQPNTIQSKPETMNKAVFLDRDGTIVEEVNYLHDPNLVKIIHGVGCALRDLQNAGYLLVVVTNQSGIGRGYYPESAMHATNHRMQEYLAHNEVKLTKIYFAPEAPDQPSRYRKPSPQALLDAAMELNIDLSQSYMVGDKVCDVEAGVNAGVKKSFLVLTGHGKKEVNELTIPAKGVVFASLCEVAQEILK